MLAAVFEGQGQLVLKDRPKPVLQRDTDALIKVTGVGICGTDLHILQVPPAHPAKQGITLGHEFTGEIVEVGSQIPDFAPGEPVLIDPHPGCGVCQECKKGNTDICIPLMTSSGEPGHPNTIGIFSDGAMTSYVIVPRQSLYKVSPSVPSHIRALAEPLACVINAVNKLKVQPGDTVLVLGAGPIGLLFTALLKANGASKVIVSEIAEYRKESAKKCGATIVVDPNKEDLAAVVARETDGGPDVVVEAVGPLLPQAIELVKTRGTVMQFGHDETVNPAVPVAAMLKKEVQMFGAFIGRYSFPRTAKIMESGQLPLEHIVSHRLPLSKVHEGLELLRQGNGLKIVLEPEEY
ncbi:alcohol dehydrogenase catalytic domain-containing protein [candidate division KSB3 bacterium]|uniref:Alcohol dehydrogenase catalytic domain-containing protein n=1 Tax=candidate division KSB3 bacterium TaxID=2044937 RepID=A0A9D5Q725_9BACT|nr:alcohol dehydrogenase catalytic domain-containing protein [candidate division KSB3 bacterium]MBD3326474.1 alcohol dehydrogenase catalytic domain-containing protein [candidate division KSB3 bacterium]